MTITRLMIGQNGPILACLAAAALVALPACSSHEDSRLSSSSTVSKAKTSAVVGPVKPAKDQADAIRLTQQEDLPAVDSAEWAAIKSARPRAGEKQTIIAGAAGLKALRATLVVRDVPPSAGENWALVTWYREEKPIRTIWVFESGEWGFERPTTSHTVGKSPELAALLARHLAAGNASGAK
ncbi:MAG: hypothetical protein NTW19_25475 [Planctomycetota bacterium]|nr:hypothetical protein [Planctomycetota bacterium]